MADMDLYDDAILGSGQSDQNAALYDDAILGSGQSDRKTATSPDDQCQVQEGDEYMDLYDDVPFIPQDLSPPRCRRNHCRVLEDSTRSDIITGSNKDDNYHLYVGNLTWWTSEMDISNAIQALGVQDFVEVKFFENPINGQSKGFCTVTVRSEEGMRKVIDRLPENELHGKRPIVTYPTRNNLFMFEAMNPWRSRMTRRHFRFSF